MHSFVDMISTIGSSVYTPAIALIMVTYNVTREVAILPLSLYVLGFTLGPIIAAPLSELYGRRAIYWGTMPLYLTFTAISGAANSVPLLVVMRFFAGLSGSGALAVGAGTFPLESLPGMSDVDQELLQTSGPMRARVKLHCSSSWLPF
jgi:MFS family permease